MGSLTKREKAIDLCRVLEGRLRDNGFHIALTGSCLYAEHPDNCGDIDLIVYPNNDSGDHSHSPEEIMTSFLRITKFKELRHSNSVGDEYARRVLRAHLKDGTQVDFFFLCDPHQDHAEPFE